jgi:hypothetical protein
MNADERRSNIKKQQENRPVKYRAIRGINFEHKRSSVRESTISILTLSAFIGVHRRFHWCF